MANERLFKFLRAGRDWEREATSIQEELFIKLPEYRNSPAYIEWKLIQLTHQEWQQGSEEY